LSASWTLPFLRIGESANLLMKLSTAIKPWTPGTHGKLSRLTTIRSNADIRISRE
jgi:hypothetical protein